MFNFTLQEAKALQIIGPQKKGLKIINGKIDNIALFITYKVPGMDLSRNHKVDLIRFNVVMIEIDNVFSRALDE